MLDNQVDNVVCWLGLALTGRLEVSVNVAYRGEMLAHILRDSGAKLLIVESDYLQRVLDVADEIPSLEHVVVRARGAAGRIDAPSGPVAGSPLKARDC